MFVTRKMLSISVACRMLSYADVAVVAVLIVNDDDGDFEEKIAVLKIVKFNDEALQNHISFLLISSLLVGTHLLQ